MIQWSKWSNDINWWWVDAICCGGMWSYSRLVPGSQITCNCTYTQLYSFVLMMTMTVVLTILCMSCMYHVYHLLYACLYHFCSRVISPFSQLPTCIVLCWGAPFHAMSHGWLSGVNWLLCHGARQSESAHMTVTSLKWWCHTSKTNPINRFALQFEKVLLLPF